MSRPGAQTVVRRGTTSADLFDRLVEAILSGRFPAGALLREAKLARQWNVSRTPLREAVRRAAEAGLLVLRPNQAPVVRHLTADDIRDLYDLRELLELHALKLAWEQIDADAVRSLELLALQSSKDTAIRRRLQFDMALHRLWLDRCGNSWLSADLEWLYQFLRIVQSWMSANHQAMRDAYDEHLAILDAIRNNDRALATRRLRQHIRHAAQVASAAITNTPASK